jgi:hypothetical protein
MGDDGGFQCDHGLLVIDGLLDLLRDDEGRSGWGGGKLAKNQSLENRLLTCDSSN